MMAKKPGYGRAHKGEDAVCDHCLGSGRDAADQEMGEDDEEHAHDTMASRKKGGRQRMGEDD